MIRKPGFIETQKSQDVNIKNKIQRAKVNKTNVFAETFLYIILKNTGLCNTCYGLLSEKWIVKRSRFHVSKLYHLKQLQHSQHSILRVVLSISGKYIVVLRSRFNRSAVTTSSQVGWINCTFQDILGQKF